jgi:hypothetical protein
MVRRRSAFVMVVIALVAVCLLVGVCPTPSQYDGNNEMRGRFTGWWGWFSPDGRKPLPDRSAGIACGWGWHGPPPDTDSWTAYH